MASLVFSACALALDFEALSSGAREAGSDATQGEDGAAPDDAVEAARADDGAQVEATTDAGQDASPPGDAAEAYAINPCLHVPTNDNGNYCGSSTQNSFANGNPSIVYDCEGQAVTQVFHCPSGCFIAPPNYDDECDLCFAKHDGVWCGSEFGFTGNTAHLRIECLRGATAEGGLTGCASGSCIGADGGGRCGP